VHLLELWRNFICGNETGSPGRAVSLHLARSGSQSEHRIRRILPARGACHIIRQVIAEREECNTKLNGEVTKLSEKLKVCKESLNNLDEQYSRRECLEVSGIPELQDENTDEHVIKVGSLMGVESIFCTPRPIYRSTYRSSVGRHIDRFSTDMSTDTRAIYRSCVGRHHVSVDILTDISTEISADISTDTRPIFRSIGRPRVVVQQAADMSIDRLPTFHRYLTATCVLMTVRHNLTLIRDFC